MSSEVRAWTETDSFYQNRSALSFYVYKLYGDSKKKEIWLWKQAYSQRNLLFKGLKWEMKKT